MFRKLAVAASLRMLSWSAFAQTVTPLDCVVQ